MDGQEVVLSVLREAPFSIGRNLASQILRGVEDNRIKKLGLDKLDSFGALALYQKEDVHALFDELLLKGIIKIKKTASSSYLPVLCIEEKQTQLEHPKPISITDSDRKIFSQFSFLDKYNDEQKKAIIEPSNSILCIAGAGTGKTTVLTKRIEFLLNFRSVPPEKILAITFTRKARKEMMQRLETLVPENNVAVETFNSFCEKILQENGDLIYDKKYNVMRLNDKIRVVTESLTDLGYSINEALNEYFSKKRLREKEHKDLFISFVTDIFAMLDKSKNEGFSLEEMHSLVRKIDDREGRHTALFMYSICSKVEELKKERGFRDYTDQLVHAIKLFESKKELIPEYEHILVDEYQDVNSLQVKLLKLLKPENIFVVGDPRQSIYGWRGSKIHYIMNYYKDFPGAVIVQLTKNYRSHKNIVDAANILIKPMNLPELVPAKEKQKKMLMVKHSDNSHELTFISHSILSQNVKRKNIFVLARTNRTLAKAAEVFAQNNIKFLTRSENMDIEKEPADDELTLSTVHAIKGLEAELVYLLDVNATMYPCQSSEHPVLDELSYYNKYDEELRLLYVALTRAKNELVVNYVGTLSPFMTKELISKFTYVQNGCLTNPEAKLREWRLNKSKNLSLKPYMIFPDRTLISIAQEMPNNLSELSRINGIGQNKIIRFGKEILEVLHGF